MKKILVTGFGPFGGETVNPAFEAVRLLPDTIAGLQLVKLELPTVFGAAGERLLAKIEAVQPAAILCVGQAGGRAAITPEKVAINYMDGRIPDNAGRQPQDEPIRPDGLDAYFTTLPVRRMAERIRAAGIPAAVSYTAGTYVCNYLMYTLLDWAAEHGMEYVVTGHYARVEQDAETGRWLLKKGLDEGKDQSYVLYNLTQEQLAHIRLPLGALHKTEVRKIAQEHSFINAQKHDSQDICFVPDGDYARFMEQFTGKHYPAGDFLDQSGKVVGTHSGAVRYTLGQRKGLGLALGAPVYVCGKDMQANTVTVGPESELFDRIVYAEDVNWIAIPALTGPLRVTARTRYHQAEQQATVYPAENGFRLEFDQPQRAPTPGQAAVLYQGDVVLGGGTITRVEK